MDTVLENRNDARTEISWPVSVWLPQANRFFNGRSSNISKKGVFVSLPMTAPVRAGSILEVNFPRTSDLAREKGQFARIKTGKVVRVERSQIFQDATVGIAVEFE